MLEFGVLGPLEVRLGGDPLALGGPKQRALLAMFLLDANEVVSRDRLVDGVWGESPPSTIAAVLNVYLSKLRRLLAAGAPETALVTRSHGYVLRIEPGQLDLDRFERFLREGREALTAGDAERAAARIREALALWRGPPLADLAHMPFVGSRLRSLEELRLSALEERIEADLALGRHFALVPELTALVGQHPLRERLRAQLMLALYRAGRQSEALQAYREARRLLAEELGIDPGEELQRLERSILVHDPSLAPVPGTARAAAAAPERGAVAPAAKTAFARRRPTRRALLVAVLAGVLVAAVAVPIFALGQGDGRARPGDGPAGPVFASGNEVAALEPETNKIVARVPVGSNPMLVREGDGSVWVADYDDQTIIQIDPESRRVVRTIGIGFRPEDLAARGSAVWAFDKEGGVLEKLPYEHPSDRLERRGFADVERLAVDEEAVWLGSGRRLIRVDAETGRVVKRADVPGDVDAVAVGEDAVWAVSGPAAAVLKVDPDSGAVLDRIPISTRALTLSPSSLRVAADADFVWVLNSSTATVTKIDPELGDIVATFPLGTGRGSLKLAAGEGAAWICNEDDGTVTRIDADTDAMTSITLTHDRPTDVAVAGGLVWVSVEDA